MAEIVMPRLSDTMEEGTVLRWLKRNGEQVHRGEELVEIETDKAAMVYESDAEGVLEIVADEGQTLPVGAPIAQLTANTAGTELPTQPPVTQPSVTQTPAATQLSASQTPAAPQPSATQTPTPQPSATQPAAGAQAAVAHAATDQAGGRVKASPLARRLARERSIDLGELRGSGPYGRIVKADVEAAADSPTPPPASEPPPAAALAEQVTRAKGATTTVELTRTQQTIARRMAESKATIPDFALALEIDMQACMELRSELKRLSPAQVPTYNDMIVKASAIALREHPRANGSYREGKLQLHARVNVGIAVATEDALVVPTVFDADLKSLGEIARETRALAERVRTGTITPPELGGGTFTVSNLGMYGVRSFTAIINPPQVAILAVGALAPRAIATESGELLARHTLELTLVCDHRVLYGADAARLLARIRTLLEEPTALTL